MTKFYKGYKVNSSARVVAEIYSKPQPNLFDIGLDVAKVVYLEDGSNRSFSSKEELEKNVILQRQISEQEYNYLCTLSRLTTEIFLHDYTGGFPREATCNNYAHHLYSDLKLLLNSYKKF